MKGLFRANGFLFKGEFLINIFNFCLGWFMGGKKLIIQISDFRYLQINSNEDLTLLYKSYSRSYNVSNHNYTSKIFVEEHDINVFS